MPLRYHQNQARYCLCGKFVPLRSGHKLAAVDPYTNVFLLHYTLEPWTKLLPCMFFWCCGSEVPVYFGLQILTQDKTWSVLKQQLVLQA